MNCACRACGKTEGVGPDQLCHECWVSFGEELERVFGQKPITIRFDDPQIQVRYDTWVIASPGRS